MTIEGIFLYFIIMPCEQHKLSRLSFFCSYGNVLINIYNYAL